MPAFVVDLRVAGKRALVVGGGRVAARRVEALLQCGAEVTVVSPELHPALHGYREAGRFQWWARPFAQGDCDRMHLAVSCVDDPAVGPQVHADARRAGAWVSVADVPELCDFYFGAVARRGPVTVSVHTDGQAPGMASRLRDEIAPILSDRALARTERFVQLRRRLREIDQTPEHVDKRASFLQRFAQNDAALDALRAPGGVERALSQYGKGAALGAPSPGKVYLVGAGPGDPELLTLKAARLIREADHLVVDALVNPEIYAGAKAQVTYVGKRAGRARCSQEEIHALLVELASTGAKVVRLKGGDPHVFGRVSEEREALAAAGIAFEVVPGISSALAAPAAAGISVTSRGVADRVVILTGHRRTEMEHQGPDLPPYRADQTLVVMMGLGALEELVAALRAQGYPAQLPAAVVSRATCADQREVVAPLHGLVNAVVEAQLPGPATVVVGHVVAEVGTLAAGLDALSA